MTTWPQAVNPVFPAGYAPTPTDMTNWIQDNFSFLTSGIVFRGQMTSSQTFTTAGTFYPLQIPSGSSTVLEDPYGGWSPSATGSQPANSWLAPYDGWYEVTVTIPLISANVSLAAAVAVSGGTPYTAAYVPGATGLDTGASGSVTVALAGGVDYIQAGAIVSATATTVVLLGAGLYPSIEITWVSNS